MVATGSESTESGALEGSSDSTSGIDEDDTSSADASSGGSSGGAELSGLELALRARLDGDRTGACIAAAVIDVSTETAIVCADVDAPRPLTEETAFEIGSISKTMTALLLARFIEEGTLALTDPVAEHLPPDVVVPSFGDEPLLLSHLVTHTAGLPSIPPLMDVSDTLDPYAELTEAQVLDSLAEVELQVAPGTQWAYSNFGFMLLSYIVTRHAEEDFEPLLRETILDPLGMDGAFIVSAPEGVEVAQGHTPALGPVPPWVFPETFAGIGGVRASLTDMVRYAEGALGRAGAPTEALFEHTMERIPLEAAQPEMGMAWVRLPVGDRTIAVHDGGTGGFSSLLLVDPAEDRAVVLLSDTSWSHADDLVVLGLHLLDPAIVGPPEPRLLATPDASLLSGLVGTYALDGVAGPVTLSTRGGVLFADADGVSLEFGYDTYGEFFPLALDALLRPVALPDGTFTFDWSQGGAIIRAERQR